MHSCFEQEHVDIQNSTFSENKLHQPKNYLKSVITTSETHEQNNR